MNENPQVGMPIGNPPKAQKPQEKPVPKDVSPSKPIFTEEVPTPESMPKDAVDVSSVKAKLMAIITEIKRLRISQNDLSVEKAKVVAQVKDMESTAMLTAIEAKGADGKPLNSNAEKRKAHADEILSKSEAYKALNAKVDVLTEQQRINDIELEFQSYVFRGMEIVSRYRA